MNDEPTAEGPLPDAPGNGEVEPRESESGDASGEDPGTGENQLDAPSSAPDEGPTEGPDEGPDDGPKDGPDEEPGDGTKDGPEAGLEDESAVGSEDGRAEWLRRLRLAGIAVAAALVIWLVWTWVTWPDVASLRTINPEETAFIVMYREARRDAGRSDHVAWTPVPYDRISSNLKRAVIASEDTEFFFHDGFSSHELREALKKAIREREAPRGASTITQQLAKNLWLTPRRSLTRKLREGILTKQLEKDLSKQRILDLYLNVVEFGPGIYGAEAAAQHYFGIPASGLSPRQGAMLAAGLPRPGSWNPSSESESYGRNVDRILAVERQLGYLDRYVGPEAPGLIRVAPPDIEPERVVPPEED
jgi:monofunctional biosynthetic peptidoglycan transglycosylase